MALELPERDPCPFCENLAGRVEQDLPRIKKVTYIERGELAAAFANPYSSRDGAVLVIPTRHAPTILDLSVAEVEALWRLVRRVAHAVHDAFEPSGMNIFQNNGMTAGEEIPHYHVHVMPKISRRGPR